MSEDKLIKIEIVKGVEGNSLYIEDYRFAGPKPWGGGTALKKWKVSRQDFINSLKTIGIISGLKFADDFEEKP